MVEPARKSIITATVQQVRMLNATFCRIDTEPEKPLQGLLPGQFAQILIPGEPGVFLRRPFSIHDYSEKKNRLSFLVQLVGKGSRRLSRLQPEEELDIILPLGNSFHIPDKGKMLLLGGGCGLAPLLFLSRSIAKNELEMDVVFGARNAHALIPTNDFVKFSHVEVCTEDGSAGCEGNIMMHPILQEENPEYAKVFACGPEPMLHAVAKWARQKNIECEVSLENTMACGFGVCLCCVTETTEGRKCVCTEGPVFNINQLPWPI